MYGFAAGNKTERRHQAETELCSIRKESGLSASEENVFGVAIK